MLFEPPLLRGTLIKRYKRFLADVMLEDGTAITASCPNTGSMLGLTAPGSTVWVSINDSPTRKYRHTLEIVEADIGDGPALVGINTGRPNRLVFEALREGRLAPLEGYATHRREVKYGVNSRIDILLEDEARGRCFLEIKNTHLLRQRGLVEFPDSVTARGAKHLDELAEMVRQGHRAVMMFLVQRGDAERCAIAADIDPAYAAAFERACIAGVEPLAYRCRITPDQIVIDRSIPVEIVR